MMDLGWRGKEGGRDGELAIWGLNGFIVHTRLIRPESGRSLVGTGNSRQYVLSIFGPAAKKSLALLQAMDLS